MNNWRENAKLFIGFSIYRELTGSSFPLRGRDIDEKLHLKDDVKLIARKIVDMTDDEFNHYDHIRYTIRDRVHGIVLFRGDSLESILYLLSIGVLPKKFEHQFETGEVIDINKMPNKGTQQAIFDAKDRKNLKESGTTDELFEDLDI